MADDTTMMTHSAPAEEAAPVQDPTPYALPAVAQELNGKYFMENPKGGLDPLETVRPADLLQDETVRRIMGFATSLSAEVARFKQHTLNDFAALLALLDQEYGVTRGGAKGNVTLTTYDGTQKVQLAIAEQITFGPELQSAKTLVDECLVEWGAGAGPELRAIVQHAFNTDKEGLVNRAELFRLLRLQIEDERWQRAMKAITDSMRVDGTKEYVRFYRRDNARAAWRSVTIDVAAA